MYRCCYSVPCVSACRRGEGGAPRVRACVRVCVRACVRVCVCVCVCVNGDLSRLVNGKVSRLLTRLILSLDPTLIPSEWSEVECTALEYTPVNGPAV